MRRASRRTWAVIAALLLALSIAVACGENLPALDSDPGREAGPPEASDATESSADAGTDAPADGNDGDAGAPCTTDMPYGDASVLDNFGGFGAVSSVRSSRNGATTAYISADLGNATSFDIGELDPTVPSPLPAYIRKTTAPEENPAPLADDKTVFWDQPIDGGARRIFSATRANLGQDLESAVEEQIPLGTKTHVSMPWSVAGTNVFYFVIRNAANDSADIHRSVRTGASWSTPSAEIEGIFDETHPVVTDDEMVIYFAQSEAGGKRKVYFAKRSSAGGPFGSPVEMPGDVNTAGHDSQPTWVSPDQCTLFFTSNRSGGMLPYKIVRVRP